MAPLLGLALLGCAPLQTSPLAPEQVDGRYYRHVSKWSGKSDRLVLAFRIFDSGGLVAVCGAWAQPNTTSSEFWTLNQQLLNDLALYLNDTAVTYDLTFFRRVSPSGDDGAQGEAACRQTALPWPAGVEAVPRIQAPNKTYTIRRDRFFKESFSASHIQLPPDIAPQSQP